MSWGDTHMKFSILGFNQQAVLDLSEDITTDDLLLLNYICEAVASPSMKHLVSNDIAYVWLQHKKILEDLPILNIGEDRLKRRLKKLSDLNLIASKQVFDEKLRGSRAFYCITELCESLRYSRTGVENNTCSDDQVLKTTRDTARAGVKNNTSDNRLFGIDKTIKKEDKGKEADAINVFLDKYHEHCTSLPKVKALTDKRKKAILLILKKYSYEDIIRVFDNAQQSDFLLGKNDRGWRADIDFILREDKFISILEGKYNNKHRNYSISDTASQYDTHTTIDAKQKLQEAIKNGTAKKY